MAKTKDSKTTSNLIHKNRHDKIALFVTNTFGSVVFLLIFVAFVAGWISWNAGLIPGLKPFDEFPFSELEMGVSIFAIFLSITVLISQKRQARLEKISQEVEFEVNVRSEKEITKVLEMLHRIEKKLGITDNDKELEEMKSSTDVADLHKQVKKG
ncbi:MAG: DUF1003 domain-containing protein [Pedobacter sp.]|nr:MAG: DUF1003 domain-containing protein [Pedobacter sp.]